MDGYGKKFSILELVEYDSTFDVDRTDKFLFYLTYISYLYYLRICVEQDRILFIF